MIYKAPGIEDTDDLEITIMEDKVRFVIYNTDDIQGLNVSFISMEDWHSILRAMTVNKENDGIQL
jgi:hypothetical protein